MKKKVIACILAGFMITNMSYINVHASEANITSNDGQEVTTVIQSDTTNSTKTKIINSFKNNSHKNNYKKDEIFIKIKNLNNTDLNKWLEKNYNLIPKKTLNNGLLLATFDSDKTSLENMLEKLNKDVNIEYAEPNYSVKIKDIPSSEPDYAKLWGLKNSSYLGIDINVEKAWSLQKNNGATLVGVIDTGVDYNHKDLKENIWINKSEIPDNGKDDDNNGYVDDYRGWNFIDDNNDPYDDNEHGTHVSGIIAAQNNGTGIVGVSPNTKIMPLKVGNANGDLYYDDIIEAMNYGVKKGVKIFNCSFSGADFSQVEYDTIKNSNALFVVAAGNESSDNDLYSSYPGNYDLPNIITVGSIDKNGSLSYFSNYGAKNVDIAAPGGEIYSTLPGGKYGYSSGTSMAAPHVAGIAALMLSEKSSLTPVEMREYILNNNHPLSSLSKSIATGAIVDAGKIMTLITTTGTGGENPGEEPKPPVQQNGWISKDTNWYYYKDGQPQVAWQLIEGKWYYFNKEGIRTTGWQSVNGYWYYLESNGAMTTGWKLLNSKWYYLNPGGDMAKGWKLLGSTWYYLEESGQMAIGWKLLGGKWYYLNLGGDMARGWKLINGTWYYLEAGGEMATGWKLLGGSWYYLNSGGDMAKGWKLVNGTWYYFYSGGQMAANTTIGGYKLGPGGAMVS
ncbi:glucan-binding YG repeat protein [Clostridium punense]|uniref:Glucan-binding YG repeat protein n=1 Tax=Clostridium punense TaxID=1054297 RepID=A0ABS4K091_9CLOT|nr:MULTISPECIES: S8 family serine peptidase [Clostridium]EQB90244.1 hypothetical protein M918_00950 [Clostridium sp. BL8]MBP2021207.1 glucan-binding YG repeat protein [Clostridium punense]